LNLMLNAFSAMNGTGLDGARRLVVRTNSIDESNVLVEVQDSGGIAAEKLESIFDPGAALAIRSTGTVCAATRWRRRRGLYGFTWGIAELNDGPTVSRGSGRRVVSAVLCFVLRRGRDPISMRRS
jgi:hypothetical protein